MTPLIFVAIGVLGIGYFTAWLVRVGFWSARKEIPQRTMLWFPVFVGLAFVAVDFYGFTIFPNGTPIIGIPIAILFVHLFLFLGTVIKAAKLGKHRCPQCGRWMEIEIERPETDFDQPNVIITKKRCEYCGFEDTKTKTNMEGVGHTTSTQSIYLTSKKKNESAGEEDQAKSEAPE